jgi:putative hydrolase of the HAD superfamily
MRYTVVLLDVGETLIGPRESFGTVYASVLEDMGVKLPADVLERALRKTWREMERLIPAGMDRYAHFPGKEREYWMRFTEKTLEKASSARVRRSFVADVLSGLAEAFRARAAWKVYPDVVPALEALQTAGVRMSVVSNWDSNLPRLLERLDLDRFFEVIGVSHLEGIEKPDPRFFLHILKRMGALKEEALHVGDVPELDIAGADAAGLDSLLVDRTGSHSGGPGRAVPDLKDLPLIAVEGLAAANRRS